MISVAWEVVDGVEIEVVVGVVVVLVLVLVVAGTTTMLEVLE
jgi:hypothetical protein